LGLNSKFGVVKTARNLYDEAGI